MPRSVFWVSVGGNDITSTLEPLLISMVITDSDGGKSDTLEIALDDAGGQIAMPPTNASIQAGIMYEDEGGGTSGPPVMFSGKVDTPTSEYTRGGGLILRISAKSADVKGKPKQHKEKHHDKGKLSAVAKKFGQDAGLSVKVADGIDVEREYWAMQGESFLNWGARIAREVGATFKVRDGEAIFADRSSTDSITGQPLPTIYATGGPDGNIISGTMSPTDDRQNWQKFRVRFYDTKKAEYVYQDAESQEQGGSVGHSNRFNHADKDSATKRGKSNSTESERDQGGGTITIDGDTGAASGCPCIVRRYRSKVDGSYKVAVARHKLDRQSGYTTELQLKAPTSGGSGGGGS